MDVKVSSRASRGQVSSISTSDGYGKDDRKRDEKTAKITENTLKLLAKVKDEIIGNLDEMIAQLIPLLDTENEISESMILEAIEKGMKNHKIPDDFLKIPMASLLHLILSISSLWQN